MIQFPLTGETTTTNLSYFDAFPKSSKTIHSKSCNYIGNLNDDPEASVIAASGCLHLEQPDQKETKYNKDKMYFTMLSKKSPTQRFFTLDINGKTEEVKPDGLDEATMLFEKEYMKPSNLKSSSNLLDSINDNSQDYQQRLLSERILSKRILSEKNGNKDFPKEILLNIAFGVDNSIKELLETEDAVENWVASVLCHMQTFYIHPSLETKILFEVSIDFWCFRSRILFTKDFE